MYLQQLREMEVRHNHWPENSDALRLNNCFDIADATLNSWKEAHDAFQRLLAKELAGAKNIDVDTHREFTRLVIRAFKDCEDFSMKSFATNKFPSECIAYAVLVAWVEQEAANG